MRIRGCFNNGFYFRLVFMLFFNNKYETVGKSAGFLSFNETENRVLKLLNAIFFCGDFKCQFNHTYH